MGQNKIQAFATDSSANVLTDDALASRSELQTGFPLKSKADSALIGKLMQNATAGAYAVGEFSAKYGTTDITGNDATGFATAFESALESYIDEKAPTPDLSNYAPNKYNISTGQLSQTTTLSSSSIIGSFLINSSASIKDHEKVLNEEDSLYSSIYFGTFKDGFTTSYAWNGLAIRYSTGSSSGVSFVTLDDRCYPTYSVFFNVTDEKYGFVSKSNQIRLFATTDQIPDVSHFVTDTTIQGYAPLAGAAFTGAVTVQEPTTASNPATKQYVDSAISSVYKYKGSVANQSALPSSNQTIGDVYNVEDTGDNFAWDGTQWDKLAGTVDLSSYLTITSAQSTYQPKGDYATNTALSAKADASALANYAPLVSPALTGTATLNGNTIATTNQVPSITSSTTDLEAGVSALATGAIYLVYE